MKYCPNCGTGVENMQYCSNCGTHLQSEYPDNYQPKSKLNTLLLCLFAGGFGAHRFYVGKTGTGILMLLFTVPFIAIYSVAEGLKVFGMGLSKYGGILVMISTIVMIIFLAWPLIDLIRIITDNFTDSNGYKLSKTTGV